MFKRFLKWLGFRRRRVPVGELCPWSGEDYKFVCRYAKQAGLEPQRNTTGAVDCTATLRQLLDCPLSTPEDNEATRALLAKTEGAIHAQ